MAKIKFSLGEHKIGYDFWESKRSLFEAFYGAFYDFINAREDGKEDLAKNNIKSKEDFYAFADWYAGGRDNCYAIGFAFYKYYLTVDPDNKGDLSTQPTDTFLGYCYHNGKFLDFLNFLLSFFPYWRNDETCTCFNPYNKGDMFFNSSWAVLVDTSKLFYFDSETVFHWITFRIKYCVDNIPGTFKNEFKDEIEYKGKITLPRPRVSGYEFKGWFDKEGKEYKEATDEDLELTAKFIRKDFYTYWEKEEPKIVKVPNPNYKLIDPL